MGRTPKWWAPRDKKQRDMFEQYRDDVKTALSTYKDGVSMGSIAGLLREILGEDIPYREMGFNTLSEFFFHLDDIFEVRMFNPHLYYSTKKFIFLKLSAISDSSSHIRDLVSHQASGSKNRRGEPKASYNNTIRVDSDEILPPSRTFFYQSENYGDAAMIQRNHPYSMSMSQGHRQSQMLGMGMGNIRPMQNTQRNFLRPNTLVSRNTNQSSRLIPPLLSQKPVLQENRIPVSRLNPTKPSLLLFKSLSGIPSLKYKNDTVDFVDSALATNANNKNSASGTGIPQSGTPVPLLQVTGGNSSTQSGGRGRELKEENRGSVFRNPGDYFESADGSFAGKAQSYNGPKSYNYPVDDKVLPLPKPGPNDRVARMARAVENHLDNDDEEDEYLDEFEFDDSSSEEYEVCLPDGVAPKQIQQCEGMPPTDAVNNVQQTSHDYYTGKINGNQDKSNETDQDQTAAEEAEVQLNFYSLPPEGGHYRDPAAGIEFEDIALGRTKLKITQVNGDLDFLVIHEKKFKDLAERTAQMTCWYNFQVKRNQLPVVERKLDKGLYAGYCEDTKTWRRVQIILAEGDKESTTAFFIDYGVLKTIRMDKIQFLKEMYCEFPRQAFFAESEFAKADSPNYDQRSTLEEMLFGAVGKDLVVVVKRVLSSESIVPLLTIEFVNGFA